MNDVVMIPAFNRPEFLHCQLQLIQRATLSENFHYIFCIDKGADPDNLKVIANFPYSHEIIPPPKVGGRLTKQSSNVFNGYREAVKRSGRYVFMIEDDIFIASDFFQWHYMVQAQNPGIFCSIGTLNHNTKRDLPQELPYYYKGKNTDYQSWGVCFDKDQITKYILPHYNNDYLAFPARYVSKTFPDSMFGQRWLEQDGIIRRIMEANDLHALFPFVPRGYHAGLYGYNRGTYTKGTLQTRIQWVIDNCFSAEKIKALVKVAHYQYDSTPVRLNNPLIKFVTYKDVEGETNNQVNSTDLQASGY